jgi:hypothetical protein
MSEQAVKAVHKAGVALVELGAAASPLWVGLGVAVLDLFVLYWLVWNV